MDIQREVTLPWGRMECRLVRAREERMEMADKPVMVEVVAEVAFIARVVVTNLGLVVAVAVGVSMRQEALARMADFRVVVGSVAEVALLNSLLQYSPVAAGDTAVAAEASNKVAGVVHTIPAPTKTMR